MMISSRGRYALRVMLDLAQQPDDNFVALKEIAARQEISPKYMGGIMAVLSKASLVTGVHGKGGGYRLNRPPAEYPVGEILRLTEGSLAPVACLEQGAAPCARTAACRTRAMWSQLDRLINDFLDNVTLADLLSAPEKDI